MLWKLIIRRLTVSTQQRMGTEKWNLLLNVFTVLFCSTFKTYVNFKFLFTFY